MTSRVSVAVIDDHPIFRSGLVQLLKLEGHYDLVAEGGSGKEAITFADQFRPEIMLLDLAMPDSGLDAIPSIRAKSPATRIVVLTASDALHDIETALDYGVSGYLLKGAPGGDILNALETVALGGVYVANRATSRIIMASRKGTPTDSSPLYQLSEREKTIARMVGQGMSNRAIAGALAVSEKTVKFHLTNIFRKLGVHNRVEVAVRSRGS